MRSVSIELLRILAMILVVISHYVFHGLKSNIAFSGFDISTINGVIDYIAVEFLYIIACVAVNCYVMITGYFCVTKKEFRWNGLIKVITATLFYSLVFLGLAFLFQKNISLKIILDALFPIHQELYWFVTAYVGLMLLHPFISRLALSLSKRNYQILLGLLFVMTFAYFYGSVYAGFSSILFFTFLFLLAGYVKLHGMPPMLVSNKGVVVVSLWLILFVFATIVNILLCNDAIFELKSSSNDCMILFLSFAVFIWFVYTRFSNRILISITKLSPYVFGVYLLHDNTLFRKDIWSAIIPLKYNTPIFIHCLVVALCIFSIGVIVDMIRQYLFKISRLNKFEDWLSKKMPQLD